MGNCIGRLCRRLVLSQAVTFADGTLTINLPAGSYANGCRYCIVVAQAIPAETILRNEFLPSCHHRWETFVSLFAGIESEFLSGQHHFVLYIPDDKEHEVFHIYVRTY